jgi:hypothetical protein
MGERRLQARRSALMLFVAPLFVCRCDVRLLCGAVHATRWIDELDVYPHERACKEQESESCEPLSGVCPQMHAGGHELPWEKNASILSAQQSIMQGDYAALVHSNGANSWERREGAALHSHVVEKRASTAQSAG